MNTKIFENKNSLVLEAGTDQALKAGVIQDSVGNSWTLSQVSQVELENPFGASGNAFEFAHPNSQIICHDRSVWDLGRRDFAIEAWFKAKDFSHGDIISTDSYVNDFSLTIYEDGHIGIFDSDWNHHLKGLKYTPGQWHHFVWTRMGNTFRVYLDKKIVAIYEKNIEIPLRHPVVVGGSKYWPFFGHIMGVKLSYEAVQFENDSSEST